MSKFNTIVILITEIFLNVHSNLEHWKYQYKSHKEKKKCWS